jgi:3-hydroxyisobutyrate dehydrogenase-like beta-hydroxyacid dehydrogenase
MRVAVLGLGRMGAAIAERLVDSGYELSVWNRSAGAVAPLVERGALALAAPAGAWDAAEVAITMLADGDALEDVTLGPRGLLADDGGGALIDMSTVSPASSARVAAACEARGIAYLRAPVSGNPSVVRAGNLGIIVSGPPPEFERLRPLLSDIGPHLFHVGNREEARIVKLGLNLMLGGTAELLAEALVLTERHGIARDSMLEVIAGSAIGSPFVGYKRAALVADDYESTFSSRLLYKDLALALDCARDAEVPLPVVALVQQLVQGCIATGMGERDFMALLPRLRREAGLT